MVLVEIEGGLGNQMFQYAAGKSLSIRLNQPLFLSSSVFKTIHDDGKVESFFPFAEYSNASSKLQESFTKKSYKNSIKRLLRLPFKKIYREKNFFYNNEVETLTSPVYIKGFWQSEKYFLSNEDAIRNSFSFKVDLNFKNTEIAKKIADVSSVSVHVRRGDYINVTENFNKHGVCEVEYFLRAFELIEKKVENPYYFIFTDDVEWIKKEILPTRPNIYLVEGNRGNDSWIDMYLMSLCKHNIIANSTFSWWAAWLNANTEKIVVSPKRWFQAPGLNECTFDLIPSQWVRV